MMIAATFSEAFSVIVCQDAISTARAVVPHQLFSWQVDARESLRKGVPGCERGAEITERIAVMV